MAYIDDPQTQKANLSYIKASMDAPLLEKDHELELARLWREEQDEDALHELTKSYTRLVISMASKFKNYGLPIGDLIQEGNIGLMIAAQKFDYKRDLRFSTYANWWIRSTIQDYVLRNWSIVRTGTTSAQKSLFFNLKRLKSKIEQEEHLDHLDEKGREEIAKTLKVKTKDVQDMEGRLSGKDQSLDATIKNDDSDGGSSWLSLLSDERPTPEEALISNKDSDTRSQWIGTALASLPEREQYIVKKRHLSDESSTLETLGDDLGISKERVRQLEKRALEKLKFSLENLTPDTENLFSEH